MKTVDPIAGLTRCCLSGGRINLHRALKPASLTSDNKVVIVPNDPNDIVQPYYETIQEAIDDANDGDTLYAESEVLKKRESGSRPGQGIVTVQTTGKKADGSVFMTYERSFLIAKRDHAIGNIELY